MDKMTIAQLKEVADQKGLTYAKGIKKDDLIHLLKTGEKPAKVGTGFRGEY